jgi:hypothetical protein
VLIPWSGFWDRNYFAATLPFVRDIVENNYVRGAVSGLGIVNICAALAELVDLFRSRVSDVRDERA